MQANNQSDTRSKFDIQGASIKSRNNDDELKLPRKISV